MALISAGRYGVMLVVWSQSFVPWWTKGLWTVYMLLCCVASFATRDHYTSDVLVALYVSVHICMHRAEAIRGHFMAA